MLVQTKFGPEIFLAENNFSSKTFGPKNDLVQIKGWYKKFGQNKFWSENIGPKIFLAEKFVVGGVAGHMATMSSLNPNLELL